MICNMITNQITKTPCPLQVVLGTLIREKELIQELYKCGIVCSNDEVLRFRMSAATASKQVTSRGLVNTSLSRAGLVQVVVDNFDANISSQNGLRSTHGFAMLLTCETGENAKKLDTTPRLRKEDMTSQIERDVPVHRYDGPKKPEMPPTRATKSVLSLRVLASQVVAANWPPVGDFYFFSRIVGRNACPEWNGFNSHLNRTEVQTMIPATTCVYTPLIDI